MPPTSATLDPFTAIAEPRRRQVLAVLTGAPTSAHPPSSGSRWHRSGGEQPEFPVTYLVQSLGWPQPQVSKHLAVLREVGLVSARRQGRQQMYRVNGERLRPIYEWVREYERFWTHQLDRIKERAERIARERGVAPKTSPKDKEKH